MQHTEKYQLNLIDPSDEFLPEPLNANARAVEAQLQAREAAEKALDAKFTAAVGTKGKTCRIVTGSYVGTGKCGQDNPNTLTFGFTPLVIFIGADQGSINQTLIRPSIYSNSNSDPDIRVDWSSRTVAWHAESSQYFDRQCNEKDVTYHYTVLGVEE